jgi:hypothetical protein
MNKVTELTSGWYLINGSADEYGQPYCVRYRIDGAWLVVDSRDREVSNHFSKVEAIASIEITP